MQDFSGNLIETLSRLAFPKIGIIDIIQIALIAFFVYQFMVWIKYTHAYTLLKGILVVLLFILIAYIFRMNTILWIFSNLASTLIVGVIVIFQPELRKVLEQLGQKRIMASLIPFDVKLHHKTPLIIEIPDRHGTGRKPDFITSYVNEAIGLKL